ncbi:hypothetical protein B0T26DRAFT_676457 [Lasiosphaeria miniovina]|uniref:Uncharacterized protein n=1 Tax=Lasiosphaeria miniovina TaxID=1954250 RepID=A0AA40ALX4_9PEZI|nr:uncharacterized protein B0T26DRAFT_676457 [Lasiosphaeria miniovina]KAK0718271.1 hypothetical protein B0T26DRAFT_676457 [Lasiosphaeria miniovina]
MMMQEESGNTKTAACTVRQPPPWTMGMDQADKVLLSVAATTVAVAPPPLVSRPPVMLARPSTSSGPAPSRNGNSRPNFDKRLSKDDMSLLGSMGMGRKKGLKPYRIGVRAGAYPTPESSPGSLRSPMPISSVPTRMPTPVSFSSAEIQIGMALGSPSHSASGFQTGWQPQPRDVYSPLPAQRTPEPPVQRQKTQKRRLFGSLFGSKKHAEPAKIAEAISANGSTLSVTATATTSPRNKDSSPSRTTTFMTRKSTKHKPLISRSKTELRMEETVPVLPSRQQQSPNAAAIWSIPSEPEPTAPFLGGPGLLDIEIPDIRLERYSIMFSGVLNPQGNSKSSLLERRQATLEKLKTINDKISEESEGNHKTRPRRGTSPAFALFPSTPGRQSTAAGTLAPPKPSPLMRSNTSPALLPSPSRADFDPESKPSMELPTRRERKTVTIVSPRTMDERNRAAQVEKLREQQVMSHQAQRAQQAQQAASTFHFGPEESGLILDSPQSVSSGAAADEDDEPAAARQALGFRPAAASEPQWQMVSPPNSTSSKASSTTTKRSMSSSASSTASSTQTHLTRPASPEVAVDQGDAALKAAVEISIARQISVSRQQRQLLRPLKTTIGREMPPAMATGGGGPPPIMLARAASSAASSPSTTTATATTAVKVSPIVITKGMMRGRVIETKQSMPTLVVPSDAPLHVHRKSERIVLEAA